MLDLLIQSVIVLAIIWVLGFLLVNRIFSTDRKGPGKNSPLAERLIFQIKIFLSGAIGFAVVLLLLVMFSAALESLR